MNNTLLSQRHNLCPIRILLGFAVIFLSIWSFCFVDVSSPGSVAFALNNCAAVVLTPTWKRKCHRRCLIKTGAVVLAVACCSALPLFVPTITHNSYGLLCVASVLLLLMPATTYLPLSPPRIPTRPFPRERDEQNFAMDVWESEGGALSATSSQT